MFNPDTENIKEFVDTTYQLFKAFFKKYSMAKLMAFNYMLHGSGNFGLIVKKSKCVIGKFSVYSSSEGNIVRCGIEKNINVYFEIQAAIIEEIMSKREEYQRRVWKLFRYVPLLLRTLMVKDKSEYHGLLKGSKVFLRPSVSSDMEYLMAWYNDYELNKLAGWTNSKVSEARLKYNYTRSYGFDPMNLIVDNEVGKPIGTIQLYDFSDLDKSCKLGIRIGDKSCWGKGYGEDAVKVLLEYAFTRMDMNRVSLRVYEYNQRAMNCYVKCGFEYEGRSRKSAYIDGQYYDEILMGALKSDFIKNQPEE